jgi:hypothetical protein
MQWACALLSLVVCLVLPYFSTLSHRRQDFKKKLLKIGVLIFSTTFVCNISHSKKNWPRYVKKCTVVFT